MIDAEAVERVRLHLVDAADAGDRFLDRLEDLALDASGDAPGYGIATDDDRRRRRRGTRRSCSCNSAKMPNTTSATIVTTVMTGRLDGEIGNEHWPLYSSAA